MEGIISVAIHVGNLDILAELELFFYIIMELYINKGQKLSSPITRMILS
jgi:hypothetical protein